MKKWAALAAVTTIAFVGIAAPAAAYSQRTTYPGGGVTWTEQICKGYGSSEDDFVQTIRLSESPNSCDYIQVRANYRNGSWVGYSSWKRTGTGYVQFAPSGSGTVNFGQHGIDSWH